MAILKTGTIPIDPIDPKNQGFFKVKPLFLYICELCKYSETLEVKNDESKEMKCPKCQGKMIEETSNRGGDYFPGYKPNYKE